MTDYQELKRLAEDCKERGIDFDDVSPHQGSTSCDKLVRHYLAAASPDVVLSMIVEIDRLRTQNQALVEFVEYIRRTGDTRLASMAIAVLAQAEGGV